MILFEKLLNVRICNLLQCLFQHHLFRKVQLHVGYGLAVAELDVGTLGLALGVAEDWGAWTPLAMLGAAAVCLSITLPVARRSRMVPA